MSKSKKSQPDPVDIEGMLRHAIAQWEADGKTMYVLAQQTEISAAVLSRLKAGKTVSVATCSKLFKALGLKVVKA